MNSVIIKHARECKFCQGALRELAGRLPPDDLALDRLLAEAVSAKEEVAFTHLLLAALMAGRKVNARHLAAGAILLPYPGVLVGAAMHMTGEVAQALLEASAKGGLTYEQEATFLMLAGVWCHDHNQEIYPPVLLARARTMARQHLDFPLSMIQLQGLADLIHDQVLIGLLEANGCPKDRALARQFLDQTIAHGRAPVSSLVPENPPPVALSGYTVRRAVPRIGRNDPCPCGSGKKYKQCCLGKDEQRLLHSSAVPGLTVEELRENQEPHLTKERLLQMRSYELARLDPAKVPPALLPMLINHLHLYAELEAVVKLFEKIGCPPELEGHWFDAVSFAARDARKDWVQKLLRIHPNQAGLSDQLPLNARLLLADEGPHPVLNLIEAEALHGLRQKEPVDIVELAYALLDTRYRALGILVARGVLPIAHSLDATTLLDALLECRDKLNLTSEEPFEDIVDQRFYEETGNQATDSQALTGAYARLEEKSKEARQLKAELDTLHKELEKREKQPPLKPVPPTPTIPAPVPAVAPAPAEDRALAELRQKLDTLREELKQRHMERNQLRRDLQTALQDLQTLRQKSTPATSPTAEKEPDEDQWLSAEESPGNQPVRIPDFPKKFSETLAALPKAVSKVAMTLIGKLAAGEAAAFVGIKRLHANHAILRQRVGADYRLLFSLKPGILEVIALINRRDLDRKIKALV